VFISNIHQIEKCCTENLWNLPNKCGLACPETSVLNYHSTLRYIPEEGDFVYFPAEA
jgi:hypothetical protein